MTMKYLTAIIMAALLLPAAALAQIGTQTVELELQNYQPAPAQPGDLLEVYVQVVNDGTQAAEGVVVEALESASFAPEGRTQVRAGSIPAGSTYLATFQVKVKAGAPEGTNLLRMRVQQAGIDWQERTLEITVRSQQSAVFVSDVTSIPTTIEPGDDATVTVTLENTGQTRLRDVSARLALEETPFIPTRGTARRSISTLLPRNTADLEFQVSAAPAATADLYRVPLTITYTDEQGEERTIEETVGLRVDAEAQTRVLLDEVTRENGKIVASVRIINKGLSEIRFLEASVGEGNYDVAPEDESAYLGNIDSDDWETFRVHFTTDAERVELPVSYTYQDAFNREHTGEATVTVDVPVVQQSGIGGWGLLIIAVLVIGGIFVWRRRKK